MSVPDFAQGVTSSSYWMAHQTSLPTKQDVAAAAKPAAQATAAAGGKSFMDDLWDVVNPLQHLPIVGTVYRAVTGDKIGDVEKVAGDTLYGGPMGLASSLADLAFEKITGKEFGATVMGWIGIGDDDKTTALASNSKPAGVKPATASAPASTVVASAKIDMHTQIAPLTSVANANATPITTTASGTAAKTSSAPVQSVVDISPQTDALLSSLQRNGVTGAMQAQALDAYRRTMTMNAQSATVH